MRRFDDFAEREAMGRPVHFEIHADDPARARRFYEALFDWSFERWGEQEYWIVRTGPEDQPGINGGLLRRPDDGGDRMTVTGWVCTVEVDDLDAALATVVANRGSIAMGKQDMGTIGWVAYARDTEDNVFGLLQYKPTPGEAGSAPARAR